MKKVRPLILLISVFILFGCNPEVWNDTNTEISKAEVKQQSFKLKDVPLFKNFVNKDS